MIKKSIAIIVLGLLLCFLDHTYLHVIIMTETTAQFIGTIVAIAYGFHAVALQVVFTSAIRLYNTVVKYRTGKFSDETRALYIIRDNLSLSHYCAIATLFFVTLFLVVPSCRLVVGYLVIVLTLVNFWAWYKWSNYLIERMLIKEGAIGMSKSSDD